MTVELISYNDPMTAGKAAAMCYASDDPERALRGAMSRGHESVAEHAVFTFKVDGLSRSAMAQLTRHRIMSFCVQSQRYCGARETVIMPRSVADAGMEDEWRELVKHIRSFYFKLRARGVPSEDARYISPEGTVTGLYLTANARQLRHFFAMRTCNRAQWEIRHLADDMLLLCKAAAPMLFKDAGAGCVRGKCQEGKGSCGSPRRIT